MRHIPRLELDQLAPDLRTLLEPRVRRLGYLGEFFKVAGHQPDLLGPFVELTENFKRVLPQRIVELGALTMSAATGSRYERHQHERLSLTLGLDKTWVADVVRLAPDEAVTLDEQEKAVQRLALAMLRRHGQGAGPELEAVVGHVGPEQAVAILFLIARFAAHAMMVNALALEPPVASVLEER
jgi:alkylhydroperoxidase family enzyme